jgi:hypothetical protein
LDKQNVSVVTAFMPRESEHWQPLFICQTAAFHDILQAKPNEYLLSIRISHAAPDAKIHIALRTFEYDEQPLDFVLLNSKPAVDVLSFPRMPERSSMAIAAFDFVNLVKQFNAKTGRARFELDCNKSNKIQIEFIDEGKSCSFTMSRNVVVVTPFKVSLGLWFLRPIADMHFVSEDRITIHFHNDFPAEIECFDGLLRSFIALRIDEQEGFERPFLQ